MITLDIVEQALSLPDFDYADAQTRMAPANRRLQTLPQAVPPRESAVLVLLMPDPSDGGLHICLTRRNENLRGHSGQISFPGGRRDPSDPSYEATALRETYEELGVYPHVPKVMGRLSMCYIPPSNFNVYPIVAALDHWPQFIPNPDEVAEVFTLPVVDLLRPGTKHSELRNFRDTEVRVPYYLVKGHKVWGATAVMLGEFEHRLRIVTPPSILSSLRQTLT